MPRKYIAKAAEPEPQLEEFRAGAWRPQMHKGRRRTRGGQGLTFVGTLVNPKTLRPYMVFQGRDPDDGVITVPTTGDHVVVVGHGYMETDPTSKYYAPAEAFGLPRVHTPGGVADKGGGLGTVLYVGMALLATYLHRVARGPLPVNGDGISSGEGASESAVQWWERAAAVGLAERETYETERVELRSGAREDEESFDVDLSDLSGRLPLELVIDRTTNDWAEEAAQGGDNIETTMRNRRLTLKVTVEEPQADGNVETWTAKVSAKRFEGETRIDDLVDLARELLEHEGYSVHEDAVITFDAMRLSWDAKAEWTVLYDETTTEDHEGYTLPIANAVDQHLVLDVVAGLDRAWKQEIDDILEVLVELDLREITDPVALRYFYALAERYGASVQQLNRMRNRAEAAKSYYQTLEFPDPEEADEELVTTMEQHGIRYVNPTGTRSADQRAEDAAYARKARELFPRLSTL